MAESRDVDVFVDEDGAVRFIHSDSLTAALRPLAAKTTIERASHVEPTPDGSGWLGDMAPVGGPVLGPFPTRAAALAAEHDWLIENDLPACLPCAAGQKRRLISGEMLAPFESSDPDDCR